MAPQTSGARNWTLPPIACGDHPYVDVRKFETRLTSANALQLFRDFDIIVDGPTTFPRATSS